MVLKSKKKVHIYVDQSFFDNIFEKHRKNVEKKIGIKSLSQNDFSRLIEDIKLKPIKNVDMFPIKKRRKKIYGTFMF